MARLLTGIVVFSAAVSLAACLVIAYRRRIAAAMDALQCVPRAHLAAFFLFATIATLSAQKTNSPPRGAAAPLQLLHFSTANLPAPLFRLESETTNVAYSYSMPTNGVRHDKWWKRGAYEDVFRLDLGGMSFPLADELLSSVWVYSWGMAGAHLGNASYRLVATGTPMSAVPGLSQFWSAALPDGARRLTWQDFALNRDTNNLVSAQLELFPNGDFIARSNEVMRVYCRVNPDDWDDDGDPNDEDANPYTSDGDFFGPHQVLPVGANTNHYYWVDVVVDCANARVVFEGDGYSHLPDPDFVARAGETNRVVLLLGKSYSTRCAMPVRVVDKEDDGIVVLRDGDSVSVVWPVQVSFVPVVRGGHATRLDIAPRRADGGSLSWPDNFCCYTFVGGVMPVFDCDGTCGCGGCSTGDITYEVGGHQMTYGGFFCHCQPDGGDHGGGSQGGDGGMGGGPSVSMSFSKDVILFEDGYTNNASDFVPRSSTDAELTCEVYGGTNGGHYALMLYDGGRLVRKSGSNIPRSGTVAAGERFRIKVKYEAQGASGSSGDISAVGTFTENGTGEALVSEAELTAVKVEIRPIVGREGFPNRHRMGVRERFQVITLPSSVQCSIQCAEGWSATNSNPITCKCPILAGANGIELNIAGETLTPNLTVVEPTGIICTRGWDRCAQGCTAMELEPLVAPLDVSFQGIAMMEVPTTTVGPSGYFTNEIFSSVWYHTVARGAGEWHKIRPDNFFFQDTASFAEYCPLPFADGTIDWEIVLAWGERDEAQAIGDHVGIIGTRYHQIFTIDGQGGLRVDKFGQWIKQFADGSVTNSPGIINTEGVP